MRGAGRRGPVDLSYRVPDEGLVLQEAALGPFPAGDGVMRVGDAGGAETGVERQQDLGVRAEVRLEALLEGAAEVASIG